MYQYQPLLRITPPAGVPVVHDLAAIDRLRAARWIPEPLFTQHESVRRRLSNVQHGWRLRAIFSWVVTPGSASETTLTDIAFAVNRRGYKVELSMDNGGLYREVALASWPGPAPLEDKNLLAVYEAEFACAEALSEDSLPPETRQSPPGVAGWA